MKKEELNNLLKAYKNRARYSMGKGNAFLDAGFVYAPYIPIQTTPVIYDCEILHDLINKDK